MTWTFAPCLAELRAQLDALYPNRSRVSDGTIGDASHQARQSDHNPDANGYVCAFDITANVQDTPALGMNGTQLANLLLLDHRCAYVIFNHRIWTPDRGWHDYTGPSAHTEHVHLSCFHDAPRRDDRRPWALGGPSPEGGFMYEIWNAKGDATLWLVQVTTQPTADNKPGTGILRIRIGKPDAGSRMIPQGAVRKTDVDAAKVNGVTVLDVPALQ